MDLPHIPNAWRERFPGLALWTSACLAASLAGNGLILASGHAPPFWPAAGLAFAFIESEGTVGLLLVWLAEMLGALAFGPLTAAVWLLTGAQALTAAAAVRLWNSYRPDGSFWENGRGMLAFICITALVQALCPATIRFFAPFADGVSPLAASHPLWPRAATWFGWFFSYLAGVVIMAPLVQAWRDAILNPEPERLRETGLLAFGLLVLTWQAFAAGSTLAGFACLPVIVAAVFLLPPRSVTTLMAFTAAVASLAAYAGLRHAGQDSAAGVGAFAAAAAFSLALPATALVLIALVRQSRRQLEALDQSRETLRSANQSLEQRVHERTADLSRAMDDVQRNLEELHSSQLRYESMFENAVQGMFECTLDGLVIRTNPALVRMLGYGAAVETASVHIAPDAASVPFASEHFFNAEDFATLVRELSAHGVLMNYEIKLKRCGGWPLWVLANLRLRVDERQSAYMEGILIDTTSIKLAEERLKRSEERLRRILNTTAEGFLIMDPRKTIRDANAAICCATGYTRQELAGRHLDYVLDQMEGAPPLFADFGFADSPAASEATLRMKHGGSVSVLVHAGVLEDGAGVEAYFVFITDITAMKKAESLREDVERITRHDLKTPLNAIINLPKLIQAGNKLDAEGEEFLQLIEDAGYRMLRLVNLSLDLYKMETGVYKLEAREVDVLPLIAKIRFELQGLLAVMDVSVETTIKSVPAEGSSRFVVWGEELLCYTMLANLMKNAIEASPTSGIVRIDLDQTAAEFVVSIHNAGEVPAAMRERMFEKYATAGKDSGTGLGCYSARLIVQTHGGTIELASVAENGATVTVRLPKPPDAQLAQRE